MKVLIFTANEEEKHYEALCNASYGFELSYAPAAMFSVDHEALFEGKDAIWIVSNCMIDEAMAKFLANKGIRYVASRAAGIDHIDTAALRAHGIKASNVPFYSPNAISEHTICLALMALRAMKRCLNQVSQNNFTLAGLQGQEIRTMRVGVVGTGRIGFETIKGLSGFGCEIQAYDKYPNEAVKDYATYVSKELLFATSDMIIFHCPLTEENYHIINKESIASMKDGVYLINTARGGLFDFEALLEALQSGKVAGSAFDVYENEGHFIRRQVAPEELNEPVLEALLQMENVIYTPHMSFFTKTATENMLQTCFSNLHEYRETGVCKNEIACWEGLDEQ